MLLVMREESVVIDLNLIPLFCGLQGVFQPRSLAYEQRTHRFSQLENRGLTLKMQFSAEIGISGSDPDLAGPDLRSVYFFVRVITKGM